MGNKHTTSTKAHTRRPTKHHGITNVLVFDKEHTSGTEPQELATEQIKQILYIRDVLHALTYTGKLITVPHQEYPFDYEVIQHIEPLGIMQMHVVLKDKIYACHTTTSMVYTGSTLRIYGGGFHSFIRTDTGFKCFGQNNFFQLGLGHQVRQKMYKDVHALNKLPIKTLYLGGWHSYAKLQDGTFLGWGYNSDGRLGDKGSAHAKKITTLDHHKLGIYKLACGGWHTVGLTRSGEVYYWGSRYDNKHDSMWNTPVKLAMSESIARVFTSTYASLNIFQAIDGSIFVFGTTEVIVDGNHEIPIRLGEHRSTVVQAHIYSKIALVVVNRTIFTVKNIVQFSDVTVKYG
jgi:hypothetical protein